MFSGGMESDGGMKWVKTPNFYMPLFKVNQHYSTSYTTLI